MQPNSAKQVCMSLKVVARDGIDTPTVIDSTQLIVLSSYQICQNVQISNGLAQIWHKFAQRLIPPSL
jgi:hypothetical protein